MPDLLSLPQRPCPTERLQDLITCIFDEPPSTEAEAILRAALDRGIVRLDDLARVFEHLQRCRALPHRADADFARHFTMWLEIINHARFIPIITAKGRLTALTSLLADRWLDPRLSMTFADVGVGHPPYTTVELAAQFPRATIDGFDLYIAEALVQRPDGAYAVFDGEEQLRGVHCHDAARLHAMILDWDTTRDSFEDKRAHLGLACRDGWASIKGWTLLAQPAQALLRTAPNPNIRLHAVERDDFRLECLAPASLDLVWSFNCLLHYPATRRHEALAAMARCLRPNGLVMEGYTSPTGGQVVYQVWRREGARLQPLEFGWTLSNLYRPLWPLSGEDPQVSLLARFLAHAKLNLEIATVLDLSVRPVPSPKALAELVSCFERAGIPTQVLQGRFIVHDTGRQPEALDLEPIGPIG